MARCFASWSAASALAEAMSVVVKAGWMPLSNDRVVVVDPSKGKYPLSNVAGGAGVTATVALLLLLLVWREVASETVVVG